MSLSVHAVAWISVFWVWFAFLLVMSNGSRRTGLMLMFLYSIAWSIWWAQHGFVAFLLSGIISAMIYLFMWADAVAKEQKRGHKMGGVYLKPYYKSNATTKDPPKKMEEKE